MLKVRDSAGHVGVRSAVQILCRSRYFPAQGRLFESLSPLNRRSRASGGDTLSVTGGDLHFWERECVSKVWGCQIPQYFFWSFES